MIKKGMLFSLMMMFSWSFSQVNWMSFNDAVNAQKEIPKKILIFFHADYCSNCKKMDRTTFQHPEMYNYINEHYYPVKFDVETKKKITYKGQKFRFDKENKTHDFALYMNVNMTPSMVFLDEKANPITILQGRLTAKELDPYVQFFATDKHLKVKTRKDWENYLQKFKSKIKE